MYVALLRFSVCRWLMHFSIWGHWFWKSNRWPRSLGSSLITTVSALFDIHGGILWEDKSFNLSFYWTLSWARHSPLSCGWSWSSLIEWWIRNYPVREFSKNTIELHPIEFHCFNGCWFICKKTVNVQMLLYSKAYVSRWNPNVYVPYSIYVLYSWCIKWHTVKVSHVISLNIIQQVDFLLKLM